MIEASEPTAQTRSTVFTLMRHVQQLHHELIADRSSMAADKELSAELMCVAALLSMLTAWVYDYLSSMGIQVKVDAEGDLRGQAEER